MTLARIAVAISLAAVFWPVPGGRAFAQGCEAGPDVVCTEAGAVRGLREGGTIAYKAIPYAKPPVGDLRWRPPQAPLPWQGVRDGARFAPPCPQIVGGKVVGEEDCLFLNVFVP